MEETPLLDCASTTVILFHVRHAGEPSGHTIHSSNLAAVLHKSVCAPWKLKPPLLIRAGKAEQKKRGDEGVPDFAQVLLAVLS